MPLLWHTEKIIFKTFKKVYSEVVFGSWIMHILLYHVAYIGHYAVYFSCWQNNNILVIMLPRKWICKKYFVHCLRHYVPKDFYRMLKSQFFWRKMGGGAGMRVWITKWPLEKGKGFEVRAAHPRPNKVFLPPPPPPYPMLLPHRGC